MKSWYSPRTETSHYDRLHIVWREFHPKWLDRYGHLLAGLEARKVSCAMAISKRA